MCAFCCPILNVESKPASFTRSSLIPNPSANFPMVSLVFIFITSGLSVSTKLISVSIFSINSWV